jgi:C4-dicarboxylate-specific signal transduction histidine kinase
MLKTRSAWTLLWTIAAALLLASAGIAGYRLSEKAGMAALSEEASHRLDLFSAAINSIVNRYARIPATLRLDPDVPLLLRKPDDLLLRRRVNAHLERLNTTIGSAAIFMMSKDGVTLAASNGNEDLGSFVGDDYTFRPYFQTALDGQLGRFYAIGTTANEPGYFISSPIMDQGQVAGVAVIKIGLEPLKNAWLPPGTPAFIADGNGVVILASFPEWRLTSLAPLTDAQAAEIGQTRQFNGLPIGRFPAVMTGDRMQTVTFAPGGGPRGGGSFLALSRQMPDNGWRLTVFSDLRPLQVQARIAAALAVTAAALVLLALMLLNMRRRNIRQRLEAQAMLEKANANLERKVSQRTADLLAVNQRLREEAAERLRAETTRREAEDQLIHAAKLAVVGQLATGITHELAQPLAALRTLSQNAIEFMRRGDNATLEKNLGIIGGMADRMAQIIGPLKPFARQAPAVPQLVDAGQAVANALYLLDGRVRRADIAVENNCPPGAFTVWCDSLRLEQVLVNLIGNAIDAMSGAAERRLILDAGRSAVGVILRVEDTGSGLPSGGERVFEPFFTTKPPGEGLGLGLAISRGIVQDFGGTLTAYNCSSGGAAFTIKLPAPPGEG